MQQEMDVRMCRSVGTGDACTGGCQRMRQTTRTGTGAGPGVEGVPAVGAS
jgi:hypothetical protein